MKIEVLCTGDELLTGLTADTNSPFFMGKVLSELGQKVERICVVGDVRRDITEALKEACARADAVLVSGGLGPTSDDVTAECAAAAFGVPLVEDAGVPADIQEKFLRRGIRFTDNNAKQARVPQGATVVRNKVGTAPMFIMEAGRCTLFFLPGVPREYQYLVEHEVLPRLKAKLADESNRVFRAFGLLQTIGLPESHLDALVEPIAQAHGQVVFGFRTRGAENQLKLLAEGLTEIEATQALEAARAACRQVLHPYLFAEDNVPVMDKVGTMLVDRGATVAVAESCTGGMLAALLTAPAGASRYFVGGFVTYQEGSKEQFAKVSAETLRRHGAVSKETAVEMAKGVRQQFNATYGVSVTGFAGPSGGTAVDPVGTVYCAVADADGVECERQVHIGDRELVRDRAAYVGLDMLRKRILGKQGRG